MQLFPLPYSSPPCTTQPKVVSSTTGSHGFPLNTLFPSPVYRICFGDACICTSRNHAYGTGLLCGFAVHYSSINCYLWRTSSYPLMLLPGYSLHSSALVFGRKGNRASACLLTSVRTDAFSHLLLSTWFLLSHFCRTSIRSSMDHSSQLSSTLTRSGFTRGSLLKGTSTSTKR